MKPLVARLALVFAVLTLCDWSIAHSQDIQGELMAVDAVRARQALEARLGAETSAGYARTQAGCEFPPCTDVQKRLAVFEKQISATPAASRRRRVICSGRRQQAWTCSESFVVMTVTHFSSTLIVDEVVSESQALAALDFLDSACFATQRPRFPAANRLPAGAVIAARVGGIRAQSERLMLTAQMPGYGWHIVELRPSSDGGSCGFELVGVGQFIT